MTRTQQGSSSHVQVQRVDVIITVSTGRCQPGVVSTGFYRRSVRRGSICKHVISLRADREFARSSSAAINTAITLSTTISSSMKPTLALLQTCFRVRCPASVVLPSSSVLLQILPISGNNIYHGSHHEPMYRTWRGALKIPI